jgi:hypothetical protein
MKRIYMVLSVCLLLLCAGIGQACDLCGCFVPKDAMRKGFQAGVAEQFSSLSQLSLDGEQLANPENQYLNSSFTQLFVGYHFNERAALQLNVPLIYRSFQRLEAEGVQRGNESGIGDVLLLGYYIPFQRKTPFRQFSWKLLAGIKIPTGDSSRIAEELLEGHDEAIDTSHAEEVPSGVHGHDIALGSGSWDAVIGTDVFGREKKWFYSGHVQYALRTRGDFNYRYANDLLWYGGPGYYLSTKDNWSLGLQALVTGEYKGEDQLGNEKTDDTAITAVYMGPTALIGIKQLATAEVGIGFPLSVENSGLQTVPKYRLRIGITWQFR